MKLVSFDHPISVESLLFLGIIVVACFACRHNFLLVNFAWVILTGGAFTEVGMKGIVFVCVRVLSSVLLNSE